MTTLVILFGRGERWESSLQVVPLWEGGGLDGGARRKTPACERGLAENAADPGWNLALKLLTWASQKALPSGVLAEQIHPDTGEPLSISPLTWSHAAFVTALQVYLHNVS